MLIMLRSFTPAVEHALQRAQQWAHRLDAAQVQPLHLLLGLVQEDEGRAAILLSRAGVAPQLIRQPYASVGSESRPLPNIPLPLAPATEQALSRSAELARDLTLDRSISSECVLLALLQQDQVLCRSLSALGLDVQRLEQDIGAAQGPPLHLDEPLRLDDPAEAIDAARILDAGANRAREALRVLEDYCRFALDDRFLSGQLKQLRHDLVEALSDLAPDLLLAARETQRDVGTTLWTERERHRFGLAEVVRANVKRLQEALRSLEEFSKISRPELGQLLEQLRYRSYTLERALFREGAARQRLAEARLYVLATGALCRAALDWTVQEAIAGGAQMIQLREKQLNDRALLDRARQVRRWTKEAGVLFIVNDRVDIARLSEADGVHLGQDDLPIKVARRLLGPDALIGVSTHNLEQVRQAILDGASYLGVGPTFPSGTKDFEEFPGLEFVRQVAAETSLPAFVLGGVNLERLGEVIAAGGKRVAVSQAICQAEDPRAAAAALRQALDREG
jgi:thiamine-phosphate pyrophosphorylase